jgi:hypothetical protein
MGIYAELLFINIHDQLAGNFPVLRRICSDTYWHALTRDFMRRHQSRTPLFTEVGQEFIDYLQAERTPRDDDWPFLLELAHYEYVELVVAIHPDEPGCRIDPTGGLMEGIPVISPTARHLAYRWPVHRIGPGYLPDEPPTEHTYLVVHRDHHDRVHFVETNAVTHRLLQLAEAEPTWTGARLLQTIADELHHPDPLAVIQGGQAMLEALRQRQIVLGVAA